MPLTQRENLMKALRREGPEFVPVEFDFVPSQVEAFEKQFGHKDYLTQLGVATRNLWSPPEPRYDDPRKLFKEELPEQITFDGWGIGHAKGSAAAMHMTRLHHPLAGDVTLSEIESYPMPGIPEGDLERLTAETAAWHDKGIAVIGYMAQTIWETAWCIRSMEELMMEMMDDDENAICLLDRITEVSIARAELYTKAGADIVHLGDDIGTQHGAMMGLEIWREWLKPRLKKVIDAAKAINPDVLISYHSCGDIRIFLEDLVDVGIDVLNPIQPECMDFQEVYDRIGDRMSFWGTIGTQQLLPFGTQEDVKAEVNRVVKICGKQGGILIGPTHIVEPEVPWENIIALRDAAAEIKYSEM